MRALLEDPMEQKGKPLRYDDLYTGGIISLRVKAFTFFDTVELNGAFLELMNYFDGSYGAFPDGDGLCENLRPCSRVPRKERSGESEPSALNAEEYENYIRRQKSQMTSKRTWKDDYLGYCLYVQAGTTQGFAASICGVSVGRMSHIFHEWSQILHDGLIGDAM